MKCLVWDLPIRVFHWGFAGCIAAALAIALLAGDHSALFPLHAIMGLSAGLLLVARIWLGLFGARNNRFAAMWFTPAALVHYLAGVASGKSARHVAHNPGAAAVAFCMFVVLALLVMTGLPLIGEAGEGIHETLAYVMLGLIAAHLAGLAVHTWRHRENIARTMVDGRREGPEGDGLRSSHPLGGAAVLTLLAVWMGGLLYNYDAAAKTITLPLFGTTIQVGDKETHRGHGSDRGESEEDE